MRVRQGVASHLLTKYADALGTNANMFTLINNFDALKISEDFVDYMLVISCLGIQSWRQVPMPSDF